MKTYWDEFLDELGDTVRTFSPEQLLQEFFDWLTEQNKKARVFREPEAGR